MRTMMDGLTCWRQHVGASDARAPPVSLRSPSQSVAGRTRRLHPCRTCREADRQRISIVALWPRGWCWFSGNDQPTLAPAHFPTPLRAPGPAATSTEIPGPVAEGGTGRRNKTPIPRLGGTTKGTEVACGCPHRVEPHAEDITHGRSGIPWAEKWPSIGILLKASASGHWG